jgi:hypothetical protein
MERAIPSGLESPPVNVRRSRSAQSLLVAVAAALAVPLLGLPATAHADDPLAAGDTVVGELVQAWPEYEEPADARARGDEGPLSWVETDSGETVRVPTEDVDRLPVGATVSVTVGAEVEDAATTEDGLEPAHAVLAAEVLAPPPSTGTTALPADQAFTNEVTVVRVVPAGGTEDDAQMTWLTNAMGVVQQFWNDASGGAIRIGVKTYDDWVHTAADCSDPNSMWNQVAGAVGFTPGPGKHLLLYVTTTRLPVPCYYGLGSVGTSPASGGRVYVNDWRAAVMAHELGHNFGLGHSGETQCDGAVEAVGCLTDAYLDLFDVMGYSGKYIGALNAPQSARLGLLRPGQQQTITATSPGGTYTLVPMSQAGLVAAERVGAGGRRAGTRRRRTTDHVLPPGRDAIAACGLAERPEGRSAAGAIDLPGRRHVRRQPGRFGVSDRRRPGHHTVVSGVDGRDRGLGGGRR